MKLTGFRWFVDMVLLQTLIKFAVPSFIMISGCLLLNPKRDVNINKIKKYILKMISILLIFGFTYCLLENIFDFGFSNIFQLIYKSIINLFQEKSWDHMWYIYMLIGLYIITPLLRKFVETADEDTTKFVLLMLFVFSFVIPMLNVTFKIKITTFYLSYFNFVFLYLLGYYIVHTDIIKDKYIYVAGVLGIIGYILFAYFFDNHGQTDNAFMVLETMLIVKLFSSGKLKIKNNKVINCISKYSLGIYLIHSFWLNLLVKFFMITPDALPIMVGELMFFIYALVLSLVSSIILYRLPIINKLFE